MNTSGGSPDDLLVRSRSALLDALEALEEQREAVVVIGAQAVYLRTGGIDVALAEATKDSDVTIDPRLLRDLPLLEEAMRRAGFNPSGQPGAWVSPDGIPVDLMVPEQLSAGGGRRSARIAPHGKGAARKAHGLEACVVDYSEIEIAALDSADSRRMTAKVAGTAALLVAKLHKIAERISEPNRLNDKDAHDIYRILRATETEEILEALLKLLDHDLSRVVTTEALAHLSEHFAAGPQALGSMMAGRAEEGVGDPDQVAVATAFLSEDLIAAVTRSGHSVERS